MRTKIDTMNNYLPTRGQLDTGASSRLHMARSNEKYPPQPASHNFVGKPGTAAGSAQKRNNSST